MLFNIILSLSLLVAGVVAAAEPVPYKLKLGKISKNDLFGLAKRQGGGEPTPTAGYQPTQTPCTGPGDTCPEACGAGTQQCASNDDELHCYDPTIGDTCCPDLSGNACSTGYYCTTDLAGGTWCCPNGMTLAKCAAIYGLTGTLVSETPTASPAAPSSSAPLVSAAPTTTYSSPGSSSVPLGSASPSTTPVTPLTNGTVTTPSVTHSITTLFTGAANAYANYGGLPALALGIAGAVAVL